jgi:hypothetical protein
MRVAPPCQLPLDFAEIATPAEHWLTLPDAAQGQALGLLARLIARGVLVEDVAGLEEAQAGDER